MRPSGKWTKHLNIHFFFVTDRIKKREVTVKGCPTGEMTGDFLTKPNQGAVFRKFRDLIMVVVPQPDPGPGKPKKKASDGSVKRDGRPSSKRQSLAEGVCWNLANRRLRVGVFGSAFLLR